MLDYNETYIESCATDYSRVHPEVSIKVEYLNSDDDFSWQKDVSSSIGSIQIRDANPKSYKEEIEMLLKSDTVESST